MKTAFVTDLISEQTITSFFLVHEKEVRNTREGRAYLRLELGDRSGTVEARMWDQFEAIAKDIHRDDFVKVQARVEVYRNRPQLAVLQVRLARPEEIDLADYLPHTAADVETMWADLLGYVDSIANPWLKQLVFRILADPEVTRCYKRAPAAKVMHHAYLGGLLEHVISLCGLAKVVAARYPELNLDLLFTAAILHDVGKLDELCYERSIGYTTPGQLLGHIVMELETVTRAIDKIEGFPPPLKTVVQHLLISHHGQYEFGSPKLPMIREAMVFHYLDDLDSKLAAVRTALATPSGDDEWSAYSTALGRRFLKLGEFLAAPAGVDRPAAGAASPQPAAAPTIAQSDALGGAAIPQPPVADSQPATPPAAVGRPPAPGAAAPGPQPAAPASQPKDEPSLLRKLFS
jgi:3'-5' exoribonuclease